ncbi:MAG TPA: ethanolamine ammonia-lyase reactivating factor EutA [Chloroflexota bacterium]|nr:ethanolamine ammonia-lyase reactivating factor EutA [Chloroflexota bacterium]
MSLGFTSAGRDILGDDHIELTSVGVDIGSSTSHLVFSHLELERDGQRYIMTKRAVLRESDILLTPYLSPTEIDGSRLETFIEGEYKSAGVSRDEVDSGAVILTGTALLRENSRTIADLFASETGKFVAVSAGDRLEASLAAHGSGAVGASANYHGIILNVDIGGGTTKLTACRGGRVESVAAIEVGARLIAFDEDGKIVRLEDAARRMAARMNLELGLGLPLSPQDRQRFTSYEADRLFELIAGKPLSPDAADLMRTDPIRIDGPIEAIVFSGGVSEFIYEHQPRSFGDLGHELAGEIRTRAEAMGVKLLEPVAGIRATVIGASQYTVQVSGNTIFVSPEDSVPIRNVPVVRPRLDLGTDEIDAASVTRVLLAAVARLDLQPADRSVALAIEWEGSATFSRLDALSRGIVDAHKAQLAAGHPLVLVCDSDVGGLLGLHIREELGLDSGIVSIDGIDVKEFDYIDVGNLIPASGAAPVVIKSLVFPGSHSG